MPIGEQIDMHNVHRIEVVYGPAATLYGADALAGIINIITHNPDRPAARLQARLGTADYTGARFFVNQINKDLRLNLYGGYSRRQDLNIDKSGDAFSDTTLFGDPVRIGRLPSASRNIGVELLLRGLHVSLDHMYRTDHSSLEQDSGYYLYDNPDLVYGESIDRASLQHRGKVRGLTLTGFVSYLRYRLDTDSAFGMIYYPSPLYKFTASDDILVEGSAIYGLTERWELVGGLTYQYSGAMPKTNDLTRPFDGPSYEAFSTDRPEPGTYQSALLGDFGFNPLTYHNLGGFFQTTYSARRYSLVAGVRFDGHSEYRNKTNLRLAGRYDIGGGTSLRAAYNEAYRAPPPYKVYNSIAVDKGDGTVFYLHVPNEGLQPEELSAFDVGLRHVLTDAVSVELTGYYYRTTALMTSGPVELDPATYPHADRTHSTADVNSRDAESILRGSDLVITWKNIWAPVKLNGAFSVTVSDGEEILPNGDEIDRFRNYPEVLAKVRLSAVPVRDLYLGLDGTYSGEWYARVYSKEDLAIPDRRSDAYFLTDLVARYRMPTRHGDVGLLLKIDNILDRSYGGYRYRDNPQYRRSFYAGVEYDLLP